MAISVVLNGTSGDASAIETAMRFAARQRCVLHVFVGAHGDADLIEQQLDFARWFLETREGLTAPTYTVERRVQPAEAVSAEELALTGGDSWV